MPRNKPNDNDKLRNEYERRVIRADGCWKWIGAKNAYGYGRMYVRGHDIQSAHRASYVLHVGPIPPGLLVLHSCDNPECTNPEHLRVGTHSDNMRDAVDRGRMVFYHRKGIQNPRAKLTEQEVINLRAIYDSGKLKAKHEARRLGVTNVAILFAVKRKTWQHI